MNNQEDIINFVKDIKKLDTIYNQMLHDDWLMIYENYCRICFRIKYVIGKDLSPELHNRMVLGPQNTWTKKYIEWCANLTTAENLTSLKVDIQ
jgi:hypothetical protein